MGTKRSERSGDMRIPEVRRTRPYQDSGHGGSRSTAEGGRVEPSSEPVPAPVRRETAPTPPAIGWQKHITFGGRTAGGINIPGGLRMPVAPERSIRPAPVENHQAVHPVVRPAPEPVGWDRNITFGGRTAGGVNIPGGLRAPVHKKAG